MSQENVEVCKRMVDRWNLGDRSMPEDEVHPDVEVVSRFRSEPFRGRDGFRHWIEEIDRHFEEWRMVVDDWRDADDRVVALGSLQLRGRSSGLQLEESAGALVELTDGKVLRLHLFGDHAEALEAAGLSG
jgi:ketosteroid isomerase-like protein